jgi:hypothetical protein
MRLPLWLKVLWTVWVALWVPVYWREYGLQNFLYFCDLGNFLILAGLWLESRLIFSWQACSLLLFETLFVIDLAGAMLIRRHFIGGTEFMFDANVPLLIRLLSLFHLVTPFLLLWTLARLGYDPRAWKWATAEVWLVAPVNYFWRPQFDINWARGLFQREQHLLPPPIYLLGYLLVVPLILLPTHWLFQRWARKSAAS